MRRLFYAVLFLLFCVAWNCLSWNIGQALTARGPLTLRVTPTNGVAPLAVTLDIHVEPEPDDRTIWLTSRPDIGRSELPLFGERSQRTYHRVWQVGEPGFYVIRAEVGNALARRAVATSNLVIQ